MHGAATVRILLAAVKREQVEMAARISTRLAPHWKGQAPVTITVRFVVGGVSELVRTYWGRRGSNRFLGETCFSDGSVGLLGVVCGAAIGFGGSLSSVGRQLRRI